MFEDDRGRLLQIEKWINRLEEGFASHSDAADEVMWWRLSRIEQYCDRLSEAYRSRHPEIAALSLPRLEQVLNEPPPPVAVAAELARRAIDTFRPLLNALPPSPPWTAPQPRSSSRHDEIISRLRRMEPILLGRGIIALYLFGSVARREDGPGSDVDLTFAVAAEGEGTFSWSDQSRLAEELSSALGSAVDLVKWGSFRGDVLERVRRDMVRIFGELCA